MIVSNYKHYEELPLFLNAKTVAQVLGVSISTAYELFHEPGFPTLRVGSRMVVPKEKIIKWVEVEAGGGATRAGRPGPSGTPSKTTFPSPTRSTLWDYPPVRW